MEKQGISELRKILFSNEEERRLLDELDEDEVSRLYFVAGLAKACAEDLFYRKMSRKHDWLEPMLLGLTSNAFDNAISIREELQDEDR